MVKRPLNGLPIAHFYGCYMKRPPELMVPAEFKKTRKTALEDVIEALGGKAVKTSGRGKCCGFPILTSNEDNSMSMLGDHTLDAKSKGVRAMVTPCPLCHLQLDGKQADAEAHKGEEIDMPIIPSAAAGGAGAGVLAEGDEFAAAPGFDEGYRGRVGDRRGGEGLGVGTRRGWIPAYAGMTDARRVIQSQ